MKGEGAPASLTLSVCLSISLSLSVCDLNAPASCVITPPRKLRLSSFCVGANEMLSLLALPSAWSPQVDGRAVASRRSAISLGAALFAPLPAFATSKEKAKQMAIQKETAKNAKQAMKEYKFAPRPELEYGKKPDGTMGYVFVEGTVKAGSQGELASCE